LTVTTWTPLPSRALRSEHHAADELHVVVPHLENAFAGLAADGKGFGEDVVERGAVFELLLELGCLALELGVRQLGDAGLEGVDGLHLRPQLADLAFVGGSKDFLERPGKHQVLFAAQAAACDW
jgi:hypothetical protein